MSAHSDRIICPQCLKRFRDAHALKTHMRVKVHDRNIGDYDSRCQEKQLRRYNNHKVGDPIA